MSHDPQQARYFHELSVRFLANAHPRIEQRVHQVLDADPERPVELYAGLWAPCAPTSARTTTRSAGW